MPESGTLVWSQEEDDDLRRLVERHGPKKWSVIAKELKSKKSKQCRRRWKNYLDVELKQGIWTPDEDEKLLAAHREHGNKWTEIARIVGGRTDNAVKNRFAALSKKKNQHRNKPARNRLPAHADVSFTQHSAVSNIKEGDSMTTSPSSAAHSSPRGWLRPPQFQAGRDPASPHGPMNSMGPRPSGFSSGSMTHEDTAQAFHPSRAGASSPYQLMPGMHPQQQQHLQQDPGFQMRQGMHPQHHQHLHRDVPYQIKHEPGRQRLLPQQPMHHHQHLQQQQQPQQHSQQQQHPMFLHQQQQQPQMHQQYGGFQPQMQGMPQQQHHRHMNMSAQIGQHMDTYPPLPTQNSAGNARAPGIDIHITQGVLTSEEQQTATEVNDMDIPINFVFEPIPLSLDPASTPRSSLAQHISPGPPSFSADGSADRTDVLRWLSSSSNPWETEPSGQHGSMGQSGFPTMTSGPMTYDSGSLGMGETPPPLGHSHRQLLRKVISIAKDTQEAVFSSPDWLTGHDAYAEPSGQDHSAVLRTPVLPPIRTKADSSSKRPYHIKVDARQGSLVGGSGGSTEAPSSGFTSMDVTDGSPIVDVLISPTFSSQELSILLDALNDPSSGIDQLAEASSQMEAWDNQDRSVPNAAAGSPSGRRHQQSPWPMGVC